MPLLNGELSTASNSRASEESDIVTRSSKTNKDAKSWTQSLDTQAVDDALDEATTDAYGKYEQHTVLLTAI